MSASILQRWFAIAAAVGIAAGLPGIAEARDWSATSARGTVLMIVDGRWAEFDATSVLSGNSAIRTLQSGRLQLDSDGMHVSIGPNAAIEIFTEREKTTTLIKQYAGTLTVMGRPDAASGVTLETAEFSVVPGAGTVSVAVTGTRAVVNVEAGSATVRELANGHVVTVVAGQTVDVGADGAMVASAARENGNSASAGNNGNGNAGNGNAGGQGNANAGGNSNGGGGNGNGNGNGNAGGDGNGNAGGNGNGNSGGTGNGDDGNGNGNGNGNSNGSGNGNGNGN